MASLGILASGRAHEINTPLGVSMTRTSYLERIKGKVKFMLKMGKPDLIIKSYPGVMTQILTNFIMNSIKHGFENLNRVFDPFFTT